MVYSGHKKKRAIWVPAPRWSPLGTLDDFNHFDLRQVRRATLGTVPTFVEEPEPVAHRREKTWGFSVPDESEAVESQQLRQSSKTSVGSSVCWKQPDSALVFSGFGCPVNRFLIQRKLGGQRLTPDQVSSSSLIGMTQCSQPVGYKMRLGGSALRWENGLHRWPFFAARNGFASGFRPQSGEKILPGRIWNSRRKSHLGLADMCPSGSMKKER